MPGESFIRLQDGLQVALFGPDTPTRLLAKASPIRGTEVLDGVWVALRNTSTNPITLQLDSNKTIGQWTFRFTCAVEAVGEAVTKPAWHGSVQSGPVETEVEE